MVEDASATIFNLHSNGSTAHVRKAISFRTLRLLAVLLMAGNVFVLTSAAADDPATRLAE